MLDLWSTSNQRITQTGCAGRPHDPQKDIDFFFLKEVSSASWINVTSLDWSASKREAQTHNALLCFQEGIAQTSVALQVMYPPSKNYQFQLTPLFTIPSAFASIFIIFIFSFWWVDLFELVIFKVALEPKKVWAPLLYTKTLCQKQSIYKLKTLCKVTCH